MLTFQTQYPKRRHNNSVLFLSQDFVGVKASVFNVYKKITLFRSILPSSDVLYIDLDFLMALNVCKES